MDISSLRERNTSAPYTVGELNGIIKNLIENDRALKAVSVRGEISNFTLHRSGHLYFTLKDEVSQIKAVMFRSSAGTLRFKPENGMRVTVRASVGVYTQGGAYQLYVNSISPDGIGELYLAYEQLKARLAEEGLFDEIYKKPLPKTPTKIGVITSPTGAAVRDIINVTGRRFPIAKIYLYPSLVQGEGAEANLCEAIEYFDKSGLCDVIIIGRGGGSIEDLWAFNSEKLARKIFECKIPIISAVGHETDFTICDLVSDKRAPTPSAAAELAVPDIRELMMRIDGMGERAMLALMRFIEKKSDRLHSFIKSLSDTDKMFSRAQDRLKNASVSLENAIDRLLTLKGQQLALVSGKLNALSPLSVLERGFGSAKTSRGPIKSIDDVKLHDELILRVVDGELKCEVKDKRRI